MRPDVTVGRWVALGAVVLSSCGVLPTPIATYSRYGLRARLVDASSGQPIRDEAAMVRIGDERFERETDGRGRVSVGPQRAWHWTWLGGPAWLSADGSAVSVAVEGYEPAAFEWHAYRNGELPVSGGKIEVGDLRMVPVTRERP